MVQKLCYDHFDRYHGGNVILSFVGMTVVASQVSFRMEKTNSE